MSESIENQLQHLRSERHELTRDLARDQIDKARLEQEELQVKITDERRKYPGTPGEDQWDWSAMLADGVVPQQPQAQATDPEGEEPAQPAPYEVAPEYQIHQLDPMDIVGRSRQRSQMDGVLEAPRDDDGSAWDTFNAFLEGTGRAVGAVRSEIPKFIRQAGPAGLQGIQQALESFAEIQDIYVSKPAAEAYSAAGFNPEDVELMRKFGGPEAAMTLFGIESRMRDPDSPLPELADVPGYTPGESVLADLAVPLVQFLAGYSLTGPAKIAATAGKVAKVTEELVRSGIAAAAAFDPKEGNVATHARQEEWLYEFFTDIGIEDPDAFYALLDSAESSSDAEGRLKLLLEDSIIGGTFMGGLKIAAPLVKTIAGAIGDQVVSMRRNLQESRRGLPGGPGGGREIGAVGDVAGLEGQRTHNLPRELLVEGTGEKATAPVVQAWGPQRAQTFKNLDTIKADHPNPLASEQEWNAMQQEAFGGDVLPAPPRHAIELANDPQKIIDQVGDLSPEMMAAADEGFANIGTLRELYESGEAIAEDTGHLFSWAFLSRGAGPMQQEGAYIDLIPVLDEYMPKVTAGTWTPEDTVAFREAARAQMPEGAPSAAVTHNVNALGTFLEKFSGEPINKIHEMRVGGSTPQEIRREFFNLTDKAGIDNKVVSFALLGSGLDDLLVLDRVASRNYWGAAENFEGANIYDGIPIGEKSLKGGLSGLLVGPRGTLMHESLEDGLRQSVTDAYAQMGREGSLARYHWESWLRESNQAVEHASLRSISQRGADDLAARVTEGKPGTFSSGQAYARTPEGQKWLVGSGDGQVYAMDPEQHKAFLAYIRKPSNGIIPTGFKVGKDEVGNARTTPWFTDSRVDQSALDSAVQQFGDVFSGPVQGSPSRALTFATPTGT